MQPCPPSNALGCTQGSGGILLSDGPWEQRHVGDPPPKVPKHVAGAAGILASLVRQAWLLQILNIKKHQPLCDGEGQAHLETVQHHIVAFWEVSRADGPPGM